MFFARVFLVSVRKKTRESHKKAEMLHVSTDATSFVILSIYFSKARTYFDPGFIVPRLKLNDDAWFASFLRNDVRNFANKRRREILVVAITMIKYGQLKLCE